MIINKRLQFVRGNATKNDTFVGYVGEITVDTTNWTLRLHDGVTPGGHSSARQLSYADIAECPVIPSDLSDLTDTSGVLFSGDYAALSNAPKIPTDLADLTDDEIKIPTDISQLSDVTKRIPTDVNQLSDADDIITNLSKIMVRVGGYKVSNAVDWNNNVPKTIAAALDRIAAMLGPIK
tara:strand:+ start:2894 stop:3430 length:537 start_codon:yes stop_codon:yes gene_type:complete